MVSPFPYALILFLNFRGFFTLSKYLATGLTLSTIGTPPCESLAHALAAARSTTHLDSPKSMLRPYGPTDIKQAALSE